MNQFNPVPITVIEPAGVQRTNWPLTVGIPFEEGVLRNGDPVYIVDETGAPLPTQTQCLTTWRSDLKYVKWLLVDWQMDLHPDEHRTVFLEHGPDIEPIQPSRPVTIEQDDQVYRIGNGSMHVVLSRTDSDFFKSCRVWTGEGWRELLLGRPGPYLYMEDNNGVSYDSWQTAPAPEVVIEESGPLRSSVRVKGYLSDGAGRRFCPYILRLHFYAGRTDIRCQHTFVFDQDPERLSLRSIGMRLPVDVGRSCDKIFGMDKGIYRGTERCTMVQSSDITFAISSGGTQATTGIHSNGLAALRGADGSVSAIIKDIWQEYPKGLALSDRDVDIQIWPTQFEPPLSFQTPFKQEAIRFGGTRDEEEFKHLVEQRPNAPLNLKSLAATTPEDLVWVDEMVAKYAPGRPASYNDTGTGNGMGAAKTTEYLLSFSDKSVDEHQEESLAAAIQSPVIPVVDPAYACATGAMRYMAPIEPDAFEQAEAGLTNLFEKIVSEPRETLRTYGMIDYGDLMCSHSGSPAVLWDMVKNDPDAIDRMKYCARSYNNEANDQVNALWGFYVRTGEPTYYLAAEAYGRHMADVDIIHAHTSPDQIGLMHYHNCHHWTGGPSPSHTCIAGMMLQYYLTGNRRILDVCREVADWAVSQQEPAGIYGNRNHALVREYSTPVANLLEFYQATWEQKYGDPALKSARWMLRAMPEPGCFPMSLYTSGGRGDEAVVEQDGWHLRQAGGMTPQLLYDAVLLDPDEPLFRTSLIHLADRYLFYKNDIFEKLIIESDTLEQLDPYFNAAVIAYAYQISGDPIYAAYCRYYLREHFPGRAGQLSFTYVCWGSIIPPLMEAVRHAEAKHGVDHLDSLEKTWIDRLRSNIDIPCPSATARPEKRSIGRIPIG